MMVYGYCRFYQREVIICPAEEDEPASEILHNQKIRINIW